MRTEVPPAPARRVAALAAAALVAVLPFAASPGRADALDWNGHSKLRLVGEAYPAGSLFRDLVGSTSTDLAGDLRLNATAGGGPWSAMLAYQLYAATGDGVELARALAGQAGLPLQGLPGDRRRLFDLTRVIRDGDDSVLLHRLDRLTVGYAGDALVVKLGRQALSWGNGLYFSPFDIVNPFDPAAIDTEYKAGDDMLYGQFLLPGGDDLQAAHVWRRDPVSGAVDAGEATTAVKYHGLTGRGEYELLVARNFGATTLGLGGNLGLGGALWRADLVFTDAGGWTAELVTNLSYSWVWAGRNVSGALEYYYNGYGQPGGRYSLPEIAANDTLGQRLARGQAFTVGRHYLAAGAAIELTPLLVVTPNLFVNLEDPSLLLQAVLRYSLGDNLSFLGAVNLPLGPDGTEFGGIPAGAGDRYLSRDGGVFAQLAWYF